MVDFLTRDDLRQDARNVPPQRKTLTIVVHVDNIGIKHDFPFTNH